MGLGFDCEMSVEYFRSSVEELWIVIGLRQSISQVRDVAKVKTWMRMNYLKFLKDLLDQIAYPVDENNE